MNLTYNERIWNQSKFTKERPKCKGCGAEILWMKTELGKYMPVDLVKITVRLICVTTLLDKDGVTHSNPKPGVIGWRPHWQTCPKAEEFRKQSAGQTKKEIS